MKPAPFRARHEHPAFVVLRRDGQTLKATAWGCRACALRLEAMTHARALRLYARHACAVQPAAPEVAP